MPPTRSTVVEAARALYPRIRAAAERTERDREVPEELILALAEAGVFRLAVPRAAGGLEADPLTLAEVFEELARADGSVGWTAMIAGASGVVLGRLDPATATGMLADPRFVIAGVAAPTGRATAVPGGYRVSGRWSYASGGRRATWLVGGCVVFDGDQPVLGPGDVPQVRHVAFPAAEVTVHDTWDTSGLAGTGSHDFEAADVLVPAERAFSLFGPAREPGPLYAFPVFGLLPLGIGAVALGIARAALDEFGRLAAGKRDPLTGQALAAKPVARTVLAEAEALVNAGRSYLHGEIGECWRLVSAGQEVPPARRAGLRLAIAHATRSAARAVDLVYRAAGAAAVHRSNPLQRCFRDVHVATQHALVGDDVYELVGAVLLDQPVNTVRL